MVEFTKTYNLKPPTADTSIQPSVVTTHAPSSVPATPHPFFQRNVAAEIPEADGAHRERFNSLLNEAARKLTQAG
jgi:hypothetical protein